MRLLSTVLVLLCCQLCPHLQAQAPDLQVFAAAGLSNGHQAFTLGEAFVSYHASGNTVVTEGFHQPAATIVSTLPPRTGAFALEIFPNPTLHDATLRATFPRDHTLGVQLIDLHGRILWESMLQPDQMELQLPLEALASAVYCLRVQGDRGISSTSLRIEKIAY